MTDNAELGRMRERIDEIDARLVKLLNRRAALAARVGEIKRKGGAVDETDVLRPEREARVVREAVARSPGDLDEESLRLLFREIISACRAAESRISVAVLGPRGTYCEAAALKHFGHQVEIRCFATIEEVFRQVETELLAYGVVPVENSTEGGIDTTLDCFQESPLTICGEINLPIRHCLLSKASALESVAEVLAHGQSLAQCRRWLATRLPGVPTQAVASNSEAARLAAERSTAAAIAAETTAEIYGLNVLRKSIQDYSHNTTRFLVVNRKPVPPSGRDKTSLMLSARNRPGALYELLKPLADNDLSMTKIESRPSRVSRWDYVFFIDFEGHCEDAAVRPTLAELKENAALCKLLGSYPMADG